MGLWSTVQLSDLESDDVEPEPLVPDSGLFWEICLLGSGPEEDSLDAPESESDLLVTPPLSDEAFFL